MKYRDKVEKKGANTAPKRIIFYRGWLFEYSLACLNASVYIDGVSEGQFSQVLEQGVFTSLSFFEILLNQNIVRIALAQKYVLGIQ
jgi:hypothetical protein